VFKRNI